MHVGEHALGVGGVLPNSLSPLCIRVLLQRSGAGVEAVVGPDSDHHSDDGCTAIRAMCVRVIEARFWSETLRELEL